MMMTMIIIIIIIIMFFIYFFYLFSEGIAKYSIMTYIKIKKYNGVFFIYY